MKRKATVVPRATAKVIRTKRSRTPYRMAANGRVNQSADVMQASSGPIELTRCGASVVRQVGGATWK